MRELATARRLLKIATGIDKLVFLSLIRKHVDAITVDALRGDKWCELYYVTNAIDAMRNLHTDTLMSLGVPTDEIILADKGIQQKLHAQFGKRKRDPLKLTPEIRLIKQLITTTKVHKDIAALMQERLMLENSHSQCTMRLENLIQKTFLLDVMQAYCKDIAELYPANATEDFEQVANDCIRLLFNAPKSSDARKLG